MKSTVYLNEESREILERLAAKEQRTHSEIVNEALWYRANIHEYVTKAVSDAITVTWQKRNMEIKRLLKEVVAEDVLPCLKKLLMAK